MIFGSKPTYLFAQYNKKKLHALGKAYSFEKGPFTVNSCVLKLSDNKVEIFFQNTIFNTYVQSVEDNLTVLKSFDEKLTVIKSINLAKEVLLTVRIIHEDENIREVEIYKFNEYFPGTIVKGTLEIKNNNPTVNTELGSGEIVLQTNNISKNVECILVKMEADGKCVYAEVNNPVERCKGKIVKDLKNLKIVKNGHIQGILLDSKDHKIGEDVHLYVKNVYPGSYAFIEDIKPGIHTVELIGRSGNVSQVRYKGFIGECKDKKVNKIMKGFVSDIQNNTFKFRRMEEEAIRTDDFEDVRVAKRIKVSSENDINDQYSAIEFIKEQAKDVKSVKELFFRYSNSFKDNEYLCLFYISFLKENDLLTETDINKVLKVSGKNFPKILSESIDDIDVLKLLFSKHKTLAGFNKILNKSEDPVKFIKENPEFISASISYAYKNLETPRDLVEDLLRNNKCFNDWKEYINHENGEYLRNLFKRMTKMNFKKNDMKNIFKCWLEFEEKEGSDNSKNIEMVRRLATEFVGKTKEIK